MQKNILPHDGNYEKKLCMGSSPSEKKSKTYSKNTNFTPKKDIGTLRSKTKNKLYFPSKINDIKSGRPNQKHQFLWLFIPAYHQFY